MFWGESPPPFPGFKVLFRRIDAIALIPEEDGLLPGFNSLMLPIGGAISLLVCVIMAVPGIGNRLRCHGDKLFQLLGCLIGGLRPEPRLPLKGCIPIEDEDGNRPPNDLVPHGF